MPRATHTMLALLSTAALSILALAGGTSLALLHAGSFTKSDDVAAAEFPFSLRTNPNIIGKAAIIFDPADGRVLFAKNSTTQLPLASITKLMTAEIVLTSESPDTLVTMTSSALAPEGDSGFKAGDTAPLGTLLEFGLIASSNDALQAAAESLGDAYIERMNQTAKNLGFTETYFLNPTGLDVNTDTSGAYSSAYDVARLAALFYKQHPAYFEATQKSTATLQVGARTLTLHATDAPLLSIPGLIGAKTGYTDLAGGNLVAVFDREIGHPLVAVVLGSTKDGRFKDIAALISAARSQ